MMHPDAAAAASSAHDDDDEEEEEAVARAVALALARHVLWRGGDLSSVRVRVCVCVLLLCVHGAMPS